MHNVVHAISMITSTRAVMLLRNTPSAFCRHDHDASGQGEAPTLDLVLAYHKANKSPILKLLLASVGKLAAPLLRP